MSLRERSIVNWIIYHLGMDRVYHAMQSMTGALKGQPQTSMISHLVNVFFGYTQLKGRRKAAERQLWLWAKLNHQTLVKYQVQKKRECLIWMRCECWTWFQESSKHKNPKYFLVSRKNLILFVWFISFEMQSLSFGLLVRQREPLENIIFCVGNLWWTFITR